MTDWPNGEIKGKEECSGCAEYKRVDENLIIEPHTVNGEECSGALQPCMVNW